MVTNSIDLSLYYTLCMNRNRKKSLNFNELNGIVIDTNSSIIRWKLNKNSKMKNVWIDSSIIKC